MPSDAGITQQGFSAARRISLQRIAGLAALACCDRLALAATESSASPRAESLADGLEHPWGMDFLPDGRLLVSERPGRLRLLGADGKPGAPIAGLPPVYAHGQGGLLDVALDPRHAENGLVYWSYSEQGSGKEAAHSGTAVARGKLSADR
ncbi:MAG: PQQ-dependent sugar dehydrogenase, partial [Zoogloea sp.]|nr:PQQ-dependent sugar dehydrogenase [Zoogloea sp.]